MTISSSTNKAQYTGNDATTIFPYDFVIPTAQDLQVYLGDTLQVAGFTAQGIGNPAGGSVTFDTAPATGVIVSIMRVMPLTQAVDYVPYDAFPAQTHEGALDKLTMIDQQLQEQIDRTVKLSVSSPAGTILIDAPEDGKVIQWDLSTPGEIRMANGPDISEIQDDVDASAANAASAAASASSAASSAAAAAEAAAQLNGMKYEENTSAAKQVFTLPFSVNVSAPNLSIYINGVYQAPSAYTINNATTVTLAESVPAGTNMVFSTIAPELLPNLTDFVRVNGVPAQGDTLKFDAGLWVPSPGPVANTSNLSIAASVAGKALTVALKTAAGADPSAGNPVGITFRPVNLTDSRPVTVNAIAPTAMVLSPGSTLGMVKSGLSVFPPAQSTTYVKATTIQNTNYQPWFATNPAQTLVGQGSTNEWVAATGTVANQRFHIDLGSAKVIKRIYFENSHISGGTTDPGVKNFIIQGSNDPTAFADLAYANNANWTNITADRSTWAQHVASNVADPQYATLFNTVAYRYYAVKCVDNYGNASYIGFRRIELQEDVTPPTRIYVWAINNAGTIEMALSRTADLYPEGNLVTTVAEGGAGAADSNGLMYSATQRTGVPLRCLGYVEIYTGVVLGEWDNAPSKVQLMGPGVKRTGDIVQVQTVIKSEMQGVTAVIAVTTAPPLITAGAEVMTINITPTHPSNRLVIEDLITGAVLNSANVTSGIYRATSPYPLQIGTQYGGTNECRTWMQQAFIDALTSSQLTISHRLGVTASTFYFNGYANAIAHGGFCNSAMRVTEIFA